MILRRIALRHVRGVKEATFEDLSERLCLFYGPNESGKSTLVEALHFGLFESSKGSAQHKKDLQTWGGNEAPEIEVTFEDDQGEVWEVEKRFLNQPRSVLRGRNVVLYDQDAEDRLRGLFGTRKPSTRGATDEDLGIWPLLWVRQGRSGTPTKDALNADARGTLADTLAQRTGEAAAGPVGQAVRARILEQHDAVWTSTGLPKKPLKDVLTAADEAEARRDELHRRYLEAQGTADRLRQAEDEVADLDRRLGTRLAQLDEVRAQAEAAGRARQQLQVHEQKLALLRTTAEHAERAWKDRVALDEELDTARKADRAASKAALEANAAFEASDARRTALQREVVRTRDEERRAVGVREAVRQRDAREAVQQQVEARRDTLAQAEGAERAIRALQEQIDAVHIRPDDVERLEDAIRKRERARDRLDATAARISITALKATTLDGRPLAAGDRHDLAVTDDTAFVLGELARIEVRPGGDDSDLREALSQAEDDVRRRLEHLLVDDLAAARARLELRGRTQREQREHEALLRHLAPLGLQAVREDLAALEARVHRAGDDADLPTASQADAAVEAAVTAREEAEAAALAHEAAHAAAQQARANARAAATAATEAVARLIVRTEGLADASSLHDAHEAARKALGDALLVHKSLQEAFSAAGGDDAVRRLEAEQEATRHLRERRVEQREAVVRLRTSLDERNEAGLYDAWQDAVSEADVLRAEADAALHKATVWKTLAEAVEGAWREMRDRLVGPVKDAIAGPVRVLFPGSDLAVDDDGDVVGLRTHGEIETFDALSGGAREQFGVLIRLGLASVLAGDGRLPVILDDALVNSDTQRRSRMVEVLRRFSDRLQVMVFTCHDEDFDLLAADWQVRVTGRPPRGG